MQQKSQGCIAPFCRRLAIDIKSSVIRSDDPLAHKPSLTHRRVLYDMPQPMDPMDAMECLLSKREGTKSNDE